MSTIYSFGNLGKENSKDQDIEAIALLNKKKEDEMAKVIQSKEIEELTDEDVNKITCGTERLLAQIYLREEKTKSGIYLPGKARDFDRFTNCVAKVIKMHPSCYRDEKYKEHGPDCKVGDWIYFKRGNGDQVNYKGHSLMNLYYDYVLGTVDDPTVIRRD